MYTEHYTDKALDPMPEENTELSMTKLLMNFHETNGGLICSILTLMMHTVPSLQLTYFNI